MPNRTILVCGAFSHNSSIRVVTVVAGGESNSKTSHLDAAMSPQTDAE